MSRCTDEGVDMTYKVFDDTIKFIKVLGLNVINLGGGEPTMHPNFIEFLHRLKHELRDRIIAICSNGTFVRNPNIYKAIQNSEFNLQVTFNKEFYKTDLNQEELNLLSKIGYVETIEPTIHRLLAYGRALDNNLETSVSRLSPMCFNMRSLIKHSRLNFETASKYLELSHKFCSPSIAPDGSILISESLCCPAIGTIYDSINDITKNIENFKCSECVYAKKVMDNLAYKSVFI